MLKNWIFRSWKHNHTYTKLIPLLKLKQFPYWIYLSLSIVPLYLFWYSIQGFIIQIVPNMKIIKDDRQRMLLKRRTFDSLVMAHKMNKAVEKCQSKSLF